MEYIIDSQGAKRKAEKIECEQCKNFFLKDLRRIKKCNKNFCSVVCSRSYKSRNTIKTTCSECGKEIRRKISQAKKSKSGLYFCSRACKDQAVHHIVEIRPSHYDISSRCRYKINEFCCYCNNHLMVRQNKYCSRQCFQSSRFDLYIQKWKQGLETGNHNNCESLSSFIRRYMLQKAGHKCEECGWNKINPITNKSPLQIDHIDGNCQNSIESNLRVLCPNCHSLTPTYGSLNSGNGRAKRREKLRFNSKLHKI